MRCLFVLTALLSFAAPAAAEEDELSARAQVQIQARMLFTQKKFDELNALAARYRITQERTPSGLWKLTELYRGLELYAQLQTPTLVGEPNAGQWNRVFDAMREWDSRSPSPMAKIALADLYIVYAWQWRSDETAGKVKPDHWNNFYANLKIAHRILSASKADASVDPEWYRAMAVLARAEQWPPQDASALFVEALARHKYYYSIYAQAALLMSPMWGGSWKAVESLANFAVKNTSDREDNALYARVYWSLSDCRCSMYEKSAMDWGRMKAGLHDILHRYPNQWNVNGFASFACRAQDKETAAALLGKLVDLRAAAWGDDPQNYFKCKNWASGA